MRRYSVFCICFPSRVACMVFTTHYSNSRLKLAIYSCFYIALIVRMLVFISCHSNSWSPEFTLCLLFPIISGHVVSTFCSQSHFSNACLLTCLIFQTSNSPTVCTDHVFLPVHSQSSYIRSFSLLHQATLITLVPSSKTSHTRLQRCVSTVTAIVHEKAAY